MALLVGAVLLPVVALLAHTELVLSRALDELTPRVPRGLAVLRSGMRIERRDGVCTGVVAQMLATEISVEEAERLLVAEPKQRFGASGSSDRWMAWATLGSFWVKTLAEEGAAAASVSSESPGDTMPGLTRHLLSQWVFLPPGVHRIVVYRTVRLSPSWEPRCRWA